MAATPMPIARVYINLPHFPPDQKHGVEWRSMADVSYPMPTDFFFHRRHGDQSPLTSAHTWVRRIIVARDKHSAATPGPVRPDWVSPHMPCLSIDFTDDVDAKDCVSTVIRLHLENPRLTDGDGPCFTWRYYPAVATERHIYDPTSLLPYRMDQFIVSSQVIDDQTPAYTRVYNWDPDVQPGVPLLVIIISSKKIPLPQWAERYRETNPILLVVVNNDLKETSGKQYAIGHAILDSENGRARLPSVLGGSTRHCRWRYYPVVTDEPADAMDATPPTPPPQRYIRDMLFPSYKMGDFLAVNLLPPGVPPAYVRVYNSHMGVPEGITALVVCRETDGFTGLPDWALRYRQTHDILYVGLGKYDNVTTETREEIGKAIADYEAHPTLGCRMSGNNGTTWRFLRRMVSDATPPTIPSDVAPRNTWVYSFFERHRPEMKPEDRAWVSAVFADTLIGRDRAGMHEVVNIMHELLGVELEDRLPWE